MPTRQQDSRFQRRNILRYVACLLLTAAVAFILPWDSFTFRVVAAAAGFGLGYTLGQFLEWLALHRYRCPHCHAPLGTDTSEWQTDREIILYCEACDIEWDTGSSTPAYRRRGRSNIDID